MSTQSLKIVKIGGKVIDDPAYLWQFLADFSALEGSKILVHGGGKLASELEQRLGLETKMVNGRRITDAAALEVVTMVYGGKVNKQIVSQLQAHGSNALGLSGADLNLIRAHQRPAKPIDFGFVGDIESVNHHALQYLLDGDIVPVLAPITHDQQGQLFNTNADTIASTLARSMANYYRVELIYCFELNGVLKDPTNERAIGKIDFPYYQDLKKQGVISGGMIPKLDNAFHALQEGVAEVGVCHFQSLPSWGGENFTGTVLCLN